MPDRALGEMVIFCPDMCNKFTPSNLFNEDRGVDGDDGSLPFHVLP